jgi:hypothetical protein
MNPNDTVTKPGTGYFGVITKLERKYQTDWVVVLWEGTCYTVRENPKDLELCPVRPADVRRYN